MTDLPSTNRMFAADHLREVEEGRMRGSLMTLKARAKLQGLLFKLGCFIERRCGLVVMLGFVALICFSNGLWISFKLETNPEKLWVEVDGPLEQEMLYTKKAMKSDYGSSAELLIQTPNTKGTNILNVEAMKQHLEAVIKATKVTVKGNDKTWSLKDLCYSPTMRGFGIRQIDDALKKLIPCVIVTPLDCFWDGAKLHGPDGNVSFGIEENSTNYKWTTLNPRELLKQFENFLEEFEIKDDMIKQMFEEAGIATGYIEKPCLNPEDPECPKTAANKFKKKPDIGVELTGGCHGYAAKFMEWPEELIVGGVTKNKSGTIRSAQAYQTAIKLMRAEDFYEFWKDDESIGHKWTLDKAKAVIKAWQHEFTKAINDDADDNSEYSILAFSSSSFDDLLKEFSKTSVIRLVMGYVLMLIYSCVTLKRFCDSIASQGALGFAGVLLVTLSVMAGLGLCSFGNIPFNAASTQVLPFLALGLGVDDMFLLAHTYVSMTEKQVLSTDHVVGDCLKSTGMSVLLTSFTNMFAFFMAAFIPIPALRTFCLQAAIVILFNCVAVILVFPAMIGLDVSRKDDMRLDFCCCVQSSSPRPILLTPSSSSTDSIFQMCNHSGVSLSSSTSADVQSCSANPDSVQTRASGAVCLPGAAYTIQATTHAEVNRNNPAAQNGRSHREVFNPDSTREKRLPNGLSTSTTATATASASAHVSEYCQLHVPENDPAVQFPPGLPERGGLHNEKSSSYHKFSKRDLRGHRSSGLLSRDNAVSCRIVDEAPTRNVQFRMESVAQSTGETSFAQSEISSIQSVSSTSGHQASPVRGLSRGFHSPSRSSSASSRKWNSVRDKADHLSLTYFARRYYGPWLQKDAVKICVLFLFAGLFGASLYGSMQVRDGLNLSDVLPRSSYEHKFVEKQFEYFSFYTMAGITKGDFDYARGQDILYKYHAAFKEVPNIIKTPEMELPKFWLMYFRDWLKDLQVAFDKDWSEGKITYDNYHDNASDAGIMAYKLLCQTGDKENPHDRKQVRDIKLVNEEGIIRPEVFYYYLTAWVSYDTVGYSTSQANIQPKPKGWALLKDEKGRNGLRIEPSLPITFSMVPFELVNLRETEDFTGTIKEVRKICTEFSEMHGLPNYPLGVAFTFWEQYIWLRGHLLKAIVIVLATSFVVMAMALMNIWAAIIIVIFLIMITVEVFGFMGLSGMKLSAVPAVTLVLSVGVGVEFTVHMCTAFLSAVGDRNRRMQSAVEQVFSPIFAGGFSTFLGVVMLAGSEFDFIVRYFFHLLVALILIGTMNGLVLLPVALSFIGPKAEVEEIEPPHTASSTRSRTELLPSSGCGRSRAPTDSEMCIVDIPETDTCDSRRARNERWAEKRTRQESKQSQRGGSKQGRTRKTSSRMTDSESSSYVLQTTVIVEVRSEQVPAERSRQRESAGQTSPAFDDTELENKESVC